MSSLCNAAILLAGENLAIAAALPPVNQLSLTAQGTDKIDQSNSLQTTAQFQRFAEVVSHNGIWYLTFGN